MLTPCQSTVRLAAPRDYPEVARLFMQDHSENGIFHIDFNKIDWLLRRLLKPEEIPSDDTGTRGLMGVIGPTDALEAVVAVVISAPWYSSEMVLNDLVLYVDPNYRHSGHAKALIEWMKYQSTITGLPLISGVITKERTEAKVRLYQRQMPVKLGAYFLHDPLSSIVTSSGVGIEGYSGAA